MGFRGEVIRHNDPFIAVLVDIPFSCSFTVVPLGEVAVVGEPV